MAQPQRLDVLVVDRDEEARIEQKMLLAEQGHGVTVLSEPAEAPEEVRGGRFQLRETIARALEKLRTEFESSGKGELLFVVAEAIRERGLLVDLETQLNSEIGRRVRERRHAAALTLKQLANRTGLSVSLISQIELGKSAASLSTLHKLAAALGVPMTYFFETL
jgi:ribosome-binding protein aMBF1 (putative translation factor)